MSGASYDLAKLKPIIRSMVMSHRNQSMAIHELERDFKAIEGFTIPYKQLGFTNLFNLLLSMPDIVQVTLRNGYPIVTYVTTAAVEHVEHLIRRNKKGRNMHVRFACPHNTYDPLPIVSRIEPVTVRNHSEMEQSSPAKVSCPKKANKAKPVMKDTKGHSNERTEQISSTEIQPPVVKQNVATEKPDEKESWECLQETCEHVGPIMGWKPSTDEWDTVNMMGLPSDVMHLTHTIPKLKLARYFLEGKETQVRVQHIFNPNRIWLRSVKQDLIMKQLTKELHNCYDVLQADDWCLEPSQVQHGLYCAALMDDNWYRARIVGPLIGSFVKLFFIDTGLLENVNYKHIKFLFNAFSSVPALAIRASLACLIPEKHAWTRMESDNLATLLASYGETYLIAYTMNVNVKLGVVDIILIDKHMNNITEAFAAGINARWTGKFYLAQKRDVYCQKRPSFNEKHPSFFCLEEGHFPTLNELRLSTQRFFDYEEYYTRMPHFEENGVVERVGREANEAMVKLHGIVSVTEEQEMEMDRTARVGRRVN